ncbi:MAG: AAA family ATPase [Neomegalonema sp.]|nr:AAA family ATPase [Neomegalonema sp.]
MTAAGKFEAAPAAAAQDEIIEFLADPATHGGAPVEHIETHGAHVFLAGDDAYKLKKAVRLPFLDYSTVARREEACRAELAVNTNSSDIYRGVRPIIRQADGGLALADDASAVRASDWVVWMRRFDREAGLDRMVDAGEVDLPLIHELADVIAAMHADAPRRSDFGGVADMAQVIVDMQGAVAQIAPEAAADWAMQASARLRANATLVEQRRSDGFVRRLHGDLHLGNIVALQTDEGLRPTPFDAIEFSERIATVDTLYCLAFSAYDLAIRGRYDLANGLVSRYLAMTGDYEGLALWPLFLSLRAAVRAMAAAYSGDEEEALLRFALASRFLAPTPPRLIAFGGLSGSGKTTIARAVAPDPRFGGVGAIHLSSDEFRKRMFGAAPEEKLPEKAYAPAVSARVHHRLFAAAEQALAAGASVVVDATFTDVRARTMLDETAQDAKARLDAFWLSAPVMVRTARIEQRCGDASDISPALAARQKAPFPLLGWRIVATQWGGDAALHEVRCALEEGFVTGESEGA